ncbi:MAG: hypothetical protein JO345_20555 [Streptosporangiaceae bacterium]|nr:hypothetical protein [Streptosporangiaceae bacterium]
MSTAEGFMKEKNTMTSDQPLPGPAEPEAADGGDPACWACLVCQECGAVVSEGHVAGCSQSSQPTGPLRPGA